MSSVREEAKYREEDGCAMPVSKSDFDRGHAEPSSAQLVINYLQDHPDQAYTANEISAAIKKAPTGPPPAKKAGTKGKVEDAMSTTAKTLNAQGFKLYLDVMVAERKLSAKRLKSNGKTSTHYMLRKGKAKN